MKPAWRSGAYLEGRSLTPRSNTEQLTSTVQSFADADHREKTAKRVHETMLRKFLAGHVVGGRVFGYRNRDVFQGVDQHGRPLRSHVVRDIDTEQAAIVRRIFELFGDEHMGLRRIAITLNREGHSSKWSASTIRAMLKRSLYHGLDTYNESKKRNQWGKKQQRPRPEAERLTLACEHLRIVDEPLWNRVQDRLEATAGHALRFSDGRRLAGLRSTRS